MKIFGKRKNKSEEQIAASQKDVYQNLKAFKYQLARLKALDASAFANYQVDKDPISGKISQLDRQEIIYKSIQSGIEEARALKEEYGDMDLYNLAKALGLQVDLVSKSDPMDFIYFGLFETPNKIMLFKDNIGKAQALLTKSKVKLFSHSFDDIVLAHEIFHYIEEIKPDLYSNTKKIDLWSLGKFYTHTSTLIAPGEISGMAFCRELLELETDPNILDYVFLAAFNFDMATQMYENLIAYE